MSKEHTKTSPFEVISGGKQLAQSQCVSPLIQGTLFPLEEELLVVFVTLPGVSEDEFVHLLSTTRPAFVVDLRPVPRFDIGQLNRQIVFGLFREQESSYIDPGAIARIEEQLCGWLQPEANLLIQKSKRPLMFLVTEDQRESKMRRVVFNALDQAQGKWRVYDAQRQRVGPLSLCC